MTDWPGTSGQGQPPDQPFYNQDTVAGQQAGWPGSFQQPGPGGTMVPASQFQPTPGNQPLMSGEPVLVTIGDISVTATTIYTPSGSRPLSELSWTFTDMSMTSQGIPTWAIVCAVVFFLFCFLGLLFLLAKENKTQGSVQVTVHGQGFVHTTTIPVSRVEQVADINARVNYVRTLTASFAPGQAASQPGQFDQPGFGQPGLSQPGQFDQPGFGQPGFGQSGQPGQPGQPGQFGQERQSGPSW